MEKEFMPASELIDAITMTRGVHGKANQDMPQNEIER